MTKDDIEARLQLIAKAAPDLRKAGVTGVTIGDIEFELAPPDPPIEPTTSTASPENPHDPLQDPDTFGGEVPRRRGDPVPDEDPESWPRQTAGGKPPRATRTS